MSRSKRRIEAIGLLGGIICKGLSFINGPECPVPSHLLTVEDINVSHRKAVGAKGKKNCPYAEIIDMEDPHTKYIALCSLCNQRMRHVNKEFGRIHLDLRVIDLYVKEKWGLEMIAREYEVHYDTVSKFLKRNGVTIRHGQGKYPGMKFHEGITGSSLGGIVSWNSPESREKLIKERRKRYYTPKRIKRAKAMAKLYDEGDTIRDIAEWFDTTQVSVVVHMRMIGEH